LEQKINEHPDQPNHNDPDFSEVLPNSTIHLRIYTLTKLPALRGFGGDKDGVGAMIGDIDVNQCEVVHHSNLRERIDVYYGGNVWKLRMPDEESGILWVRAIFGAARHVGLDSVYRLYNEPKFSTAVFGRLPLRIDFLTARLRAQVVFPPVSWKPSDYSHPCELLDPGVLLAALMRGIAVNAYRYCDLKNIRSISKSSGFLYYVPSRGAEIDVLNAIRWINGAENRENCTVVTFSDIKKAARAGQDKLEALMATYLCPRPELGECAITCGGGGSKYAITPQMLQRAQAVNQSSMRRTAVIDPDYDYAPQFAKTSIIAPSSGGAGAVASQRSMALDPLQREILALAGHEEAKSKADSLEMPCQYGAISFCSSNPGGDEDFILPLEYITKAELLGHANIFHQVGTTPHLLDCCVSLWLADLKVQAQIAELKEELEKCVKGIELIFTPGADLSSLDLPRDTVNRSYRRKSIVGQVPGVAVATATGTGGGPQASGATLTDDEAGASVLLGADLSTRDDEPSLRDVQGTDNSSVDDKGHTYSTDGTLRETVSSLRDSSATVVQTEVSHAEARAREIIKATKETHPVRIEMIRLATRVPPVNSSLAHITWRRRRTVRRKETALREQAKACVQKLEDLIRIEHMPLHIEFPSQGAAAAWITAIHYLRTLRRYEQALIAQANKRGTRPPPPIRVKIGPVIPPPPEDAQDAKSSAIALLKAKEEEDTLAKFAEKIKSGAYNYVALRSDPPCRIPKGTYYSEGKIYQEKNNVLIGELLYEKGPLPFRSPKTGNLLYRIKDSESGGEYIIATDGFIYDPIMRERIGKLEIEYDRSTEIKIGPDGEPIEEEEEDDEDGDWFAPGGGAEQYAAKMKAERERELQEELKRIKREQKRRAKAKKEMPSDEDLYGPGFIYDDEGLLVAVPCPVPLPPGTFFNPPFVFQIKGHYPIGRLVLERYLPFPSARPDWVGPIYQIKIESADNSGNDFIIANDGYIYDIRTNEKVGEIDTTGTDPRSGGEENDDDATPSRPRAKKSTRKGGSRSKKGKSSSKKGDSKSRKGDAKSSSKSKKGDSGEDEDLAAAIEHMNEMLIANLPPELANEVERLKAESLKRAEQKYRKVLSGELNLEDEGKRRTKKSKTKKSGKRQQAVTEESKDASAADSSATSVAVATNIADIEPMPSDQVQTQDLGVGEQDKVESSEPTTVDIDTESHFPDNIDEHGEKLGQANEVPIEPDVAGEARDSHEQLAPGVVSHDPELHHEIQVPVPVQPPPTTATGLRIRRVKRSELKGLDAEVVEQRVEIDASGHARKVLIVKRKRASILRPEAPNPTELLDATVSNNEASAASSQMEPGLIAQEGM